MLPTIDTYYNSESNNTCVTIGSLTLYFSYKTIVGIRHPSVGTVCRENLWGPTTGKHLNAIEHNKKKRLSSEKFEEILNKFRIVVFNYNNS